MPRSALARRLVAALGFAVSIAVSFAWAFDARADPPPPGSWGAELESVAQWLAQNRASHACSDHCFVLTHMKLTGAADATMAFSLEGAVLAGAPAAVPLFGPPTHARVDGVRTNGKPAAVGFEGDHWYVVAPPGRFVIEGGLTLDGDLALSIPGPLDALDAELSRGRIVEGAHLSGLQGTAVHVDRATVGQPPAEPPVFQLSRAVRIAREITFEYRLVMRSGQDLGVVHLPLAYGEKVIDVQGSTGWNVQGGDLVLPTAGRSSSMTITGTLTSTGTSIGAFRPDPRSSYEWWLVESDAEHRMTIAGDAPQIDASESPIPRSLPSARLLLVGRGQHVDVSAQSLVASDVLAAVIRSEDRTVVLTTNGDLVADDTLLYENNGIDWLSVPPSGRVVFQSTDGRAERVMRQSAGAGDVLLPLRVGSHAARLQSVASASLGTLGGVLSVPVPPLALTASHVDVRLGLPSSVHPLAVLGGERRWFVLGAEDLFAIAVSAGVAIAAMRGRVRRGLGAVAVAGLWFVSPVTWWALTATAVVGSLAWLSARMLPRGPRIAAWALMAAGAGVFALGLTSFQRKAAEMSYGGGAIPVAAPAAVARLEAPTEAAPGTPPSAPVPAADGDLKKENFRAADALGSENARLAVNGIVQGVAPVALSLPGFERSVVVTRELVTRERPFIPEVLYVTTAGLVPLVIAWLACLALLARLHRGELSRFGSWLRARLARNPEAAPTPAPPTATSA
jgi:hypothetical protein